MILMWPKHKFIIYVLAILIIAGIFVIRLANPGQPDPRDLVAVDSIPDNPPTTKQAKENATMTTRVTVHNDPNNTVKALPPEQAINVYAQMGNNEKSRTLIATDKDAKTSSCWDGATVETQTSLDLVIRLPDPSAETRLKSIVALTGNKAEFGVGYEIQRWGSLSLDAIGTDERLGVGASVDLTPNSFLGVGATKNLKESNIDKTYYGGIKLRF